MSTIVAALYVQRGGAYYGLEDVDPWDEARVVWRVEQKRGGYAVRVRVETWGREERVREMEQELEMLRGAT